MKNAIGTTGLDFQRTAVVGEGLYRSNRPTPCPNGMWNRPPLDDTLKGDGPDFPDLSELEVVRHFTQLSQWNFGVDSGFYPLGSCTMKYNPKTNERQASLPGLPAPIPCCPRSSARGPWN
jgi:glycine dehydrogenase subunit 2